MTPKQEAIVGLIKHLTESILTLNKVLRSNKNEINRLVFQQKTIKKQRHELTKLIGDLRAK